jgi:hypothetical protein
MGAGRPVVPLGSRHLRLFTRVAENQSNVAVEVIRRSIDAHAVSYLRCYDYDFVALRDPPSGTTEVSLDIADQLPRRVEIMTSTFAIPTFEKCIQRTVVGQTMNEAGPGGSGHVVYDFRFEVVD